MALGVAHPRAVTTRIPMAIRSKPSLLRLLWMMLKLIYICIVVVLVPYTLLFSDEFKSVARIFQLCGVTAFAVVVAISLWRDFRTLV